MFDLNSLEEFSFLNIRPYDPDDPNGADVRRIYVKLVSLDKTNWEVNDFITATTEKSESSITPEPSSDDTSTGTESGSTEESTTPESPESVTT